MNQPIEQGANIKKSENNSRPPYLVPRQDQARSLLPGDIPLFDDL